MDEGDIAAIRQWRDDHADPMLRHHLVAPGGAALWESVNALLRELDRRIDPDDLNDEQTAVYEAGYLAGQRIVADRLRRVANDLDQTTRGDVVCPTCLSGPWWPRSEAQ